MRVALLVVLWLLAWGESTFANVLSGVAVASIVLVAFPPSPRRHGDLRLSAVGMIRLAGYVLAQLVVSNIAMARNILSARPETRPAVLAHRLDRPSDEAVTVITSVIALSPGTMTVDVDPTSTTIYVHFFRLGDVDAARAQLARLERLVIGALSGGRASDPPPAPSESP